MKNVLCTGATGFLGQAIRKRFQKDNFITVGRKYCDIISDLSVNIPVIPPSNLVIHAAGKAHCQPKTIAEKNDFFAINVKGTENLLKGLAMSLPIESFVFISSVAVYGKTAGELIMEDSPLNAEDPYGLSKIIAEQIVQQWCEVNNVICTILRLPLLVGPNPPGNLGSMIKGIQKGYYFNIDGGKARKSMVVAYDVARIISRAAEVGGIFNLTDGYHPSFFELSECISKQLGKSSPLNIPRWLALLMAYVGDLVGPDAPINSKKLLKITSDLTFDDSKARTELGWNPNSVLKDLILS